LNNPLKAVLPQQGLIVSCQAETGTPTDFVEMIVAFAKSAEMGGAVGFRLAGKTHVAAVRAASTLPIIGIEKVYPQQDKVIITGDHTQIAALIAAGAQMVAFDATDRPRPSSLERIVQTIHASGALALADLRSIADLDRALQLGVDAVTTTLSVWDLPPYVPDIEMIREIRASCDLPVIAEGNFWTPDDVRRAFDAGAYAVVVGSAITRPWMITEYFARSTP
jgi:N-acylglucosamine-6-phosphate 2-epimerase